MDYLAAYRANRLKELRGMKYEDYLKTKEWQHKRGAALARACYRCEKCGKDDNLNVHHKTYERRGAELPEDLIVLCKRCHELEHGITPAMAKE